MPQINKGMAFSEVLQGVLHLSEALLYIIHKLNWWEYSKIPPFNSPGPFLSKQLSQKVKVLSEADKLTHTPQTQQFKPNCWVSGGCDANGLLKWGL